MTSTTPAESLHGEKLSGGWVVGRRLPASPFGSGGQFSVGYEVRRGRQRAFLKALDVNAALSFGGVLATHVLTGGQWSEAELLQRCAEDGLSRVVQQIDVGVWTPSDRSMTPVPYIIMEWADGGDLGRAMPKNGADVPFALAAVHGIACALQQLHSKKIAHRDVRPSNGVFVEGRVKISDLGHAADLADSAARQGPHGASHYAPPEVLFESQVPSAAGLRSADLYLLGSLLLSVVAVPVPLTTLWIGLLEDDFQPDAKPGTLDEVMPYIRYAYNGALEFALNKLSPSVERGRLEPLVRCLTDPDPTLRGHSSSRAGVGDSLELARVVTEIDLLRRRSEARAA